MTDTCPARHGSLATKATNIPNAKKTLVMSINNAIMAQKLGLKPKRKLSITNAHKRACQSLNNANHFLGPLEDYGLTSILLEKLEDRGLVFYRDGRYLLTDKGKSYLKEPLLYKE